MVVELRMQYFRDTPSNTFFLYLKKRAKLLTEVIKVFRLFKLTHVHHFKLRCLIDTSLSLQAKSVVFFKCMKYMLWNRIKLKCSSFDAFFLLELRNIFFSKFHRKKKLLFQALQVSKYDWSRKHALSKFKNKTSASSREICFNVELRGLSLVYIKDCQFYREKKSLELWRDVKESSYLYITVF